jgi:glutathione synthase/RimK-type ligase-like ATP-grasp enzyme
MERPIAICQNERVFKHSGSWNKEFIAICQDKNILFEVVDCYDSDIIHQLDNFSGLIWPIENWVLPDIMEGRSILRIAEQKGINVFPNQNTVWHFDDKIAEMYAFQAVGAPIPESWVFYLLDECIEWLETAKYPLVAKLRCGSGANNVKLLKSETDAVRYAKRMFTKGYNPAPSLLYKAYSKGQSSRDLKTFISRIKRIPEFLHTRRHGQQLPVEKGYCYFQEFVPNAGYDIKIAVVGDKLSFITRDVRKGDFRASGGGTLKYDKSQVPENVIDSAFSISEKLGLQCMGFDYVVDQRDGEGKIIEMSYGFDWKAVLGAGGYWNKAGVWYDLPLNILEEIIAGMVVR